MLGVLPPGGEQQVESGGRNNWEGLFCALVQLAGRALRGVCENATREGLVRETLKRNDVLACRLAASSARRSASSAWHYRNNAGGLGVVPRWTRTIKQKETSEYLVGRTRSFS
jgi:hypothetical protein